jgi:hypothetical protein
MADRTTQPDLVSEKVRRRYLVRRISQQPSLHQVQGLNFLFADDRLRTPGAGHLGGLGLLLINVGSSTLVIMEGLIGPPASDSNYGS